MHKKIVILLLVFTQVNNIFSMQQPPALTCQVIKAAVNDALKAGNTDQFKNLPTELLVPAHYLYQSKNNPTVALFNNYVALHYSSARYNATSFLSSCGANSKLVYKALNILNYYSWDVQKAFDYGLVRKGNIKGIELFVLSTLGDMIDINAVEQYSPAKLPALFQAISAGDSHLVQLLIDVGADVNFMGQHERKSLTPLIWAVYTAKAKRLTNRDEATTIFNHYKKIIKSLLEAGADINTVTSDTDSALSAAGGDEQLTNFLKKYGANEELVKALRILFY